MAPSPDAIFLLGYFFFFIFFFIFIFFFFTPQMLFHVLHISNIFPGTQPKEGTDEDLQNASHAPCLYDCCQK